MIKNNFSPLDGRYREFLPHTLSEQYLLQCQAEVEGQWLVTLSQHRLAPSCSWAELEKIFSGLTFREVEKIETRTQHATRALVEVLAARLRRAKKKDLAEWVHVGLTSFDTVDTSYRLRLKRYCYNDFSPLLNDLKDVLRKFAEKYQQTVQVGRTHGQWAVPTFFGLSFAEAYHRIEQIEKHLWMQVEDLRGQASGAVGGYQAIGLMVKDPLLLEADFLRRLGLKPHLGSTQILPPEDVYLLASSFFVLNSVVAKLANDLRHLARSEIWEVSEGMSQGQVGSSTMPQKRNPWNLEHVCSLYKVLQSRLLLMADDLVTEHQRDLTNSASGRFYVEFFALSHLMIHRLTRVLQRLQVYPDKMIGHYEQAGTSIYAEALYVKGCLTGVKDAHHVVREASRQAESQGMELLDVLMKNKNYQGRVDIKKLQQEVLRGPFLKMMALMSTWKKRR